MKQFFNIDRRKKDSIVSQIIEQTISYINDYKLIQGSKLPSLEALKIEFSLSDKEIHLILDSLMSQGYLKKSADNADYIVQKTTKDSTFLVDVSPIYRSILNLGLKPHIETIEESYITVDYELASFTGFKNEEKVFKVKKIYYGDNRPLVYAEMYFSLDQLPGVDKYLVPNEPHQDILFKQFPLAFKYHLRELNVVSTPEEIQKFLKLTEKDPINTLGRYHFYNLQAQVVEFGVVHLLELNDFITTIIDLSNVHI
jgi:GntR family transcriptional regulator